MGTGRGRLRRISGIGVAVFAFAILSILAMWAVNYAEPADFAQRDIRELRRVECNVKGKVVSIPADRWPELIHRLAALRSAPGIGWAGERWTYSGHLELEWEGDGLYSLSFATRPSLGGRQVMELSKKGRFGWDRYWFYEADDLLRWLEHFA